jgi:2-polyprenyl-3-methyl-5-hydroxy-6-metoxy-1,4-benzoquinol methylase
MSIKHCMSCGNKFFKTPLLVQRNMPKSAQYLPEKKKIESDKGIDLKVYQCSGCGMVQLADDPVPYYREVIRAACVSDEVKKFRRKQFEKLIKKYGLKGKKFIEIGCGKGDFLEVVGKLDICAYGLEYSKKSVEHCKKNGLNVFRGYIDKSEYGISGAPFDFFFILNFLEHMPDPKAALRGIYNNLTENALGLVEVPNFDMILRNRLFSEFVSDHLLYFTRETLVTLLNNTGFNIVECKEERYDYIISALVRKRKKTDISDFVRFQKNLEYDVKKYIEKFGKGKVAIWGAGHQALSIISLLDLSGKIRYVIDSAEFKQNKYTPASHIRIVSPQELFSDPVDAIIVIAAAYSDEVAGLIGKKYDKNIKIAILREQKLEIMPGKQNGSYTRTF